MNLSLHAIISRWLGTGLVFLSCSAALSEVASSKSGDAGPSPSASGIASAHAPANVHGKELFAAVENAEAVLSITDQQASMTGGPGVVIVGDGASTVSYWMTVENRSDKPLRFAWPKYIFLTLENWKNPWASEARTPEFFYLQKFPAAPDVVVEGGKSLSTLISKKGRWYLGNCARPVPHDGVLTKFRIKPAPMDSPYVRLAESLEAVPSLLEDGGRALFALLAEATPEKALKEMILKRPPAMIRQMREILATAGLPQTGHAFFDETEKKQSAKATETGAPSGRAAAEHASGSESLEDLIAKATTETTPTARATALQLIARPGHRDSPRAIETLIDRMQKDPDAIVRRKAADYLRTTFLDKEAKTYPDARIESALIESLKTEKDSSAMRSVLHALAASRSKAAIPHILPLLDEKEFASGADDALEKITGKKGAKRTRRQWETILSADPVGP
ncbi:MAG: HEAT repeat domain-containing protein [Verrucomicrobia bacterium]|nr:HEAT repeat domain-containing protein [Verrucomicrobiota bacterium]